jgi:ribulose-bisphosphate carboxylase large chain
VLRVTYRLAATGPEAMARAGAIALEQTVEVPAVAVRDPFVAESIVGQVEAVEEDGEAHSRVTIAYAPDTTAHDPAQLLNVVFGMTSLQPDAECLEIELPKSLRQALQGPRFGSAGLRALVDAPTRSLTATAVKPMGQSPEALASLLREFARAGVDLIKDDQGLADHPFCPFEARVSACLRAADEVAQETGHRALYVPNLIGTPSRVFDQLRIAEDLGARAVMVAPMLLGLPTFWELCHERASVPVLAHPSLAGVRRFSEEALYGTLLRAYGADAVIFVSYGGRYGTPREACRAVAERLREPSDELRASLPVPGGGITLDEVSEVVDFYGSDVMLLVGGNLLVEAGAVESRARTFVEAVRATAAGS